MAGLPSSLALAPVRSRGEGVVVHDATFEAWDQSFGVMRDVVNQAVDVLNQAGAGLPHLPRESLHDLLVAPLSGDYGAIRANAVAARATARDLDAWCAGLGGVTVQAAAVWGGEAATAFVARSTRLLVQVEVAARLVHVGARALDRVAEHSERLGVRVERLVVELGQCLARLVRRILARVAGPAGWAVLATQLLTEGLSTVTDVVDDVRRVVALVGELVELRETVRDWARSVRDDLDPLLDLRGLVG